MPHPSLLFGFHTPEHPRIPSYVTEDLQLSGLLSEMTLTFLRTPPGSSLISERQELFRALIGNSTLLSRLGSFRVALSSLERAYDTYRLSQSELERYCLFASLIHSYRHVTEELSGTQTSVRLLKRVTDYFGDSAHTALDRKLSETEKQMRELLGTVRNLRYHPGNTLQAENDRSARSYCERISKLAGAVGIELQSERKASYRIDPALSDAVKSLYPDVFSRCSDLLTVSSETEIYPLLSYMAEIDILKELSELFEKAQKSGFPLCFPDISQEQNYTAINAVDLSLLRKGEVKAVPNEIAFDRNEPFFFLTGANGGGKTTYIRTVGINLLLFLAGCPICAESALIYPFSGLLSHFPKDEQFLYTGRLDEEKKRVDGMLTEADSDTFLLFNETYSGTDEEKGCRLTTETVSEITDRHLFGLFVTHFHQVSEIGIPMLTAVIDETDGNRRTYRIRKNRGINSSYAQDILRKYRLDRESLDDRFRREQEEQPS